MAAGLCGEERPRCPCPGSICPTTSPHCPRVRRWDAQQYVLTPHTHYECDVCPAAVTNGCGHHVNLCGCVPRTGYSSTHVCAGIRIKSYSFSTNARTHPCNHRARTGASTASAVQSASCKEPAVRTMQKYVPLQRALSHFCSILLQYSCHTQ